MIGKAARQYKTFKALPATKNILYNLTYREKKASYGKGNPGVTFYVIRGINSGSRLYTGVPHNLLANYFYVVSHLKYARDRGWAPVVDQLNYPVYTSLCGEIGGVSNAWEYFWGQPSGYTLEEVYNSRDVVLSKRSWFSEWDMGYDAENYTNKGVISFYRELTDMIPLKKNIADGINSARERLFKAHERVLGVSFRFAGHSRGSVHRGPGHPVSPEIGGLLELTEKRLGEWRMDKVFLASDEESCVKRFEDVFNNKLVYLTRKRGDRQGFNSDKPTKPMYEKDALYATTAGYLTEMELLAGCTGIIGTVTSGLRYAVVRNNCAYEHTEILDCGRFPDKNKR